MDISSGNISAMVFKRVFTQNLGQLSLDGQSLTVLMELDGNQSVGAIARKTALNMATLRAVLSRLLSMKLIEPSRQTLVVLDGDFLDFLDEHLSRAIGPIAGVLIEDAIADLGFDHAEVPGHQAAELVDQLARNIRREDKMIEFKQNMIRKIKEKGY